MGYYENPPIINPSRGGEIIGASIAQAGESIAQGLIARGERKRADEKERKLTLQKLQDRKNETDLYYAEKQANWSQKQTDINPEVNRQIKEIIQQKLHDASDARISLLNETDTAKRQEYLQTISNAESLLENASAAGKSIGGVAATYRLKAKASTIGKPGGYVVNGKSDEDINNNTAFLDSLSGMANGNPLYKSSNIEVTVDETGGGFNIRAYGEHADGTKFNRPLNTKAYIDSEESVGDGLLLPVESLDSFYTDAKMQVADKDNNILEGYLVNTHDTVDLPSTGGDQYQIINGRKLNVPIIQDRLKKKAEIKAAGILSADNSSSLRTLIDYTLEQGPGWYDKNFAKLSTDEKNSTLVNMMTQKSFDGLTAEMQKTPDGKGGFNYWNPDGSSIKIKEKPAKTGGGNGTDGTDVTDVLNDPRLKQFNNLFSNVSVKAPDGKVDRLKSAYKQRQQDAKTLNQLVGGKDPNMFRSRDDLFEQWKKTSINEGTKDKPKYVTNAERLKRKDGKMVMNEFNKAYPGKTSIFMKSGGVYVEPQFDTKTKEGLVDLVLSVSGEGVIKKFGPLSGAASERDQDIKNETIASLKEEYPKKPNETLEAYSRRIAQLYNKTN